MVRARDVVLTLCSIGLLVLVSASGGCGSRNNSLDPTDDASTGDASFGDDSGGSSGGSGSGMFGNSDGAAPAACSGGGLQCYVPAGCTTTLSGKVYDPAGINPLYNVAVFIPNDPNGALTPIKQGTNTCNTCDVSIGDYVSATTSAVDGSFTLTNVPATTHVPLVVQIGKWRREVFLPQVKACTANTVPGSSLTRLPTKRSEGDLPQMAVVTGGADNLGCFLKYIGLDASEYSAPGKGGRLDVYQGLPSFTAPGLTGGTAGDCTSDNTACVWHSKANFEKYDIVLLACEGNPYDPDDANSSGQNTTNKTPSAKQALHDWLDEGGKVFATHYHYTWFKNSPSADFKGVANWLGGPDGAGRGTANYDVDQSFSKGKTFYSWLGETPVSALTGTQISLSSVADSVSTVNPPTQRWIYDPSSADVKYMSFETPIGGIPLKADAGEGNGPQYCGKAVFTDLHTGGGPSAFSTIPSACTAAGLTDQLKALEFLFFDLSACVSDDSLPPPGVPQPAK
jgi:hypothetical protein